MRGMVGGEWCQMMVGAVTASCERADEDLED